MLLLFISAKHFNDFLEKFFFKAITPAILILLVVFLFKFKKCKFKELNGFTYFVIFYVIFDLLLRLYYTFILDMDNQTRYFNVQVIFYLVPAALAWEFLSESVKMNKQKFMIATCTVLFLYGAIRSIRPKWDKPEYHVFAEIIKNDSEKNKYAFILEEKGSNKLHFHQDMRLSYYAGLYRKKELSYRAIATNGSCYIITEKPYTKILDFKLEFIESVTKTTGVKSFLYKITVKASVE